MSMIELNQIVKINGMNQVRFCYIISFILDLAHHPKWYANEGCMSNGQNMCLSYEATLILPHWIIGFLFGIKKLVCLPYHEGPYKNMAEFVFYSVFEKNSVDQLMICYLPVLFLYFPFSWKTWKTKNTANMNEKHERLYLWLLWLFYGHLLWPNLFLV